jgi:hypothetical protein
MAKNDHENRGENDASKAPVIAPQNESSKKGVGVSRRDFMGLVSSILFSGGVPDALEKLAAGVNPYPWITDPRVLAAMGELDKLNEQSKSRLEFKVPNVLDKYVLGLATPDQAKVSDTYTLYSDPFWKLLSGPRSKASIQQATQRAQQVLQAEAAIEPRRMELVKQITNITGEEPWLLRLEPQMADFMKRAMKETGYQFVPPEGMMSYLKEGVGVLQRYLRAYTNGTLKEFVGDEYQRIYHKGYDVRGSQQIEKAMKGDDYKPSKKETDSMLGALKHFLNLPSTQIDSNAGTPAAYVASIHNRKDVRGFVRHFVKELYADKEGAKFMQVSENSRPLEGMAWAHGRPGTPGYITISEPPLELMELIEEAKKKKELSASRGI